MANRKLLCVALAATTVAPLPVLAQLEEVLVTARKREESILRVPVVATVIGQEAIEQFGTKNLFDITERIPGLNFSTGTMSFGAQVSMRGVGTTTLNTTLDQSVALNIDGMQMTQGLAYAAGMFDMSQVEVLKGPQALFFGKAAPGGVISVRTADPGNEFELIGRYGFETEAKEHKVDLIASGPVTDTLGVRVAGTWSDAEGFMRNRAYVPDDPAMRFGALPPKERDFAPQEDWIVRLTALWQPTEQLSARFKVNATHSRREGDAYATILSSCPDGIAGNLGFQFLNPSEDCKYNKTIRIVDLDPAAFPGVRNGGTPFSDVDQVFGTLELNYDLNQALRLTSVTGYYDLDQSSLINGTSSGYIGTPLGADPRFVREDYTQELRLTSSYGGPLNFMAGAFYQKSEMTYYNNLLGNTFLGMPGQINSGYQPLDIRSYSLFGQVLWQMTPTLELGVGVRWTDEEREHEVWDTITGSAVRVPTATPKLSAEDVSPEVTLTWTPTDTVTLFASYKEAFKAGSFDTVTIKAPGSEVSFGDEKIQGYEAGIKTRLLDNQLALNAAVYFYKFDDMQVGANTVTETGQLIIRTYNAASSELKGIDLDAEYAPSAVPGLTVHGALNYNKAEFDDFPNAECWGGQTIQEGCNRQFNAATGLYTAQDLSGKPLLRSPELTAVVGANYEWPIANGMRLALGWFSSYSDEYVTNVTQRRDMVQDSYFIHNLSIELKAPDDRWTVALIGNNLEDEMVAGNCPNSNYANSAVFGGVITGGAGRGPGGVEEITCDVANRRSIWLRFSMNFANLF